MQKIDGPLQDRREHPEGHAAERAAAREGAGRVRRRGARRSRTACASSTRARRTPTTSCRGRAASRRGSSRRPTATTPRSRSARRATPRASARSSPNTRRRRGVTRDRLYLDMMQSVLGNTSKVIVDQKAAANLLYLPLDKLMQQVARSRGCAPSRRRPRVRRGRRPRPEPLPRAATPLHPRRPAQPRTLWSPAHENHHAPPRPRRGAAARRVAGDLHRRPDASARSSSSWARSSTVNDGRRACTSRCRSCQNVRYFDRRNLTLENARRRPRRHVGEDAARGRLRRAVADHRRAPVLRRGAGQRGPRAERACRRPCAAISPRNSTRRTMHEAISTGRDQIMTVTRQKADQDARNIGVEVVDVRLRRLALPTDVTGPRVRAHGVGAPARGQRAALDRRRGVGEDPRRRRSPAPGDPRRRLSRRRRRSRAKATPRRRPSTPRRTAQNPEFFAFYRSLEAYKATFRGRNDLMVLDPSGEFFQYFKQSGAGRAPRAPAK